MKDMSCFILGGFLLLCGCAASTSGHVYTRAEARRTQTVQVGQVIDVREVLIEGTKSGIGTAAGGALGYVLGRSVGSGSGKDVATAAGAIGGAAAGAAAEEGITRHKGLEITVNLDTGQTVAVVQAADEMFSAGDRVRIVRGEDGTTRVVRE